MDGMAVMPHHYDVAEMSLDVSQRPGMSSDGRNSTARRMRGAGKCEGDGNVMACRII